MEEKLFKTEIVNESGSRVHTLLFLDGTRRIFISPGTPEKPSTGWVEQGRKCVFAPFKKVVYKQDGSVKLTKRTGFKKEKMEFGTELKNESKLDIQILGYGATKNLYIPRGIPVYFAFPVTDVNAEYANILWTVPKPTGEMRFTISDSGFPMQVAKTLDIWKIRRDDKDLQKLLKVRQGIIEVEKQKDIQFEKDQERRRLRLEAEGV